MSSWRTPRGPFRGLCRAVHLNRRIRADLQFLHESARRRIKAMTPGGHRAWLLLQVSVVPQAVLSGHSGMCGLLPSKLLKAAAELRDRRLNVRQVRLLRIEDLRETPQLQARDIQIAHRLGSG